MAGVGVLGGNMPKRYFAASTMGLYSDDVNQTMPEDAVLITEQQYVALAGKIISIDDNGNPVVAPPPTSSRWISKWLFNLRFTQQERIAIYTSTDPVVIMIRSDYLVAPDPMNMDDTNTNDLLDYFTSVGILAAGRKATILT